MPSSVPPSPARPAEDAVPAGLPAPSTTPSTARREHGIDQIRGLAVLLVVLAHVRSIPIGMGVEVNSELLLVLVREFHVVRMPVLLVLSGLLLGHSLRKPPATYYRGKAEKILWPFLVWSAVTAVAQGAPERILETPVPYLVGGPWHLWFLWVLLACHLVGPIVRLVPAGLLVCVLLVGTLAVKDSAPDWVVNPLFWGAFFFLGAAFGPHLARIRRLPWPAVLAAAVWTIVAVTLHLTSAELLYISPDRPVAAFLGPLGAIVVALWLSGRLPRSASLEFVGRRSLVVYVAHVPVIMVVSLLLGEWAEGHRWSFYAITGLAAVAIPVLMARAYGPLRWLFESPTAGPRRRGADGPARRGGPAPRRVPRHAA